MRFLVLLSLTTCLAFNAIHAQQATLKGKVIDENKEGLPFAYVISEAGPATTTDVDGYYSLSLDAGDHVITFSYVGYSSQQRSFSINSGQNLTLDVNMTEDMERLNVTIISASRYEKNIAEETVSVNVVDKDFLENTNSRDIGEAINQTAGVQVQDGQISIRSGSSWSYGVGSRTALLQDGIGLQTADLGESMLKFAAIETVDQVEIIKGASSVVYGSSALNGVVNLVTKWPKKNDQYTDIIPYYGFYGAPPRAELNWWKGEVGGRQPGLFGVFVSHYRGGNSFKREKLKNFSMITGANFDVVNSFLQGADEFRIRGNFKTRYVLARNKNIDVGLNGNFQYENLGQFFLSQDLDSNAYRIAQGATNRYARTILDPHFSWRNDKGHSVDVDGRYMNNWRRGNGDDINSNSHAFNLQTQYQWNFKNRFIMTTGMPIGTSFSESSIYANRRITLNAAVFNQLEYKVDKLSLVGGVRYEIMKVDEFLETSIPVFRSGLNYQLGKATHLRMSWGQAYRLPSVGERFVTGDIFQGFYLFPNPELNTERGWSSEIAIKQGFKLGDNFRGYIDFATFLNEFDEYVEYVPGIYENVNPETGDTLYVGEGPLVFCIRPEHTDEARIWGYEFTMAGEGDITPWLNLRGSVVYDYTYPGNLEQDTTLRNIGTFFKKAFQNHFRRIDAFAYDPDAAGLLFYRSRHIIRNQVEVKFRNKFTLGFAANYTSFPEKIPELFITALNLLDDNQQTFLQYIEEHQRGDWILFLRSFYEVNDFVRIGLLINNLTNRELLDRPGKITAPRNFTFQMKFSF